MSFILRSLTRVYLRLLSFLLVSSFVASVKPALAQVPVKQWDVTLGGAEDDQLSVIRPTPDGGFITGGISNSDISGDKSEPLQGGRDFWVVKLNAEGQKQWDRTFGGEDYEYLRDITATADGGYLLGGVTSPPSLPSENWVIKLDANGRKQWDHTLGGTGAEGIERVRQTSDGGYLLGGYSTSNRGGDKSEPSRGEADYWLVKLDAQGSKLWDRTYGGAEAESLTTLELTRDGGCLIGGFTESGISVDKTQPNWGSYDYWVLKLDGQGNKQWDASFGGSAQDRLSRVCQTPEGGFLLAGGSNSPVSGTKTAPNHGPINTNPLTSGYDYWVVKLDANGQKQWEQAYGTPANEELSSVALTADGGFVLGGSALPGVADDKTSPGQQLADYWLLKLTATGTREWDLAIGSSSLDMLSNVHQTTDGGFIVGGTSHGGISGDKGSASRGRDDFWVVKLGAPTVRISGDAHLCVGGQIQLTAVASGPGASFLWNTGATTAAITISQPGTYSVTSTFANGQTSTAQHVITAFVPTVQIQADTLLCPGSSVVLVATGGSIATYEWSTGATTPSLRVAQPGTYTVTVCYGSGCTLTRQVTVHPASLRLQGPSLLCAEPGSSVQLEALAPGATSYRWNTGATTPSLVVKQAGTYSVVATFSGGGSLTVTHTLTRPQVTVVGDSLVCPGRSLLLRAGGTPAVAYRWSTGQSTATLSVSQPGVYTLTATYAGGCNSTTAWHVQAPQPLPAERVASDTTLCEGSMLLLQAPKGIGSGVSYQWSDGSSAASLAVRAAGTYALVLATPCQNTTYTWHVAYRNCLKLPNVVTANGDGLNDRFAPEGLGGAVWSLVVFNRWGKQVYESPAYRNEWGPEAPAGVYYFLLRQATTGLFYKGYVEIIR